MSDREKTLLLTILLGLVSVVLSLLLTVMFHQDRRLDRLNERVTQMERFMP